MLMGACSDQARSMAQRHNVQQRCMVWIPQAKAAADLLAQATGDVGVDVRRILERARAQSEDKAAPTAAAAVTASAAALKAEPWEGSGRAGGSRGVKRGASPIEETPEERLLKRRACSPCCVPSAGARAHVECQHIPAVSTMLPKRVARFCLRPRVTLIVCLNVPRAASLPARYSRAEAIAGGWVYSLPVPQQVQPAELC